MAIKKPKDKQKAFTLIELLVVISIIGLLASVVLVALNQVRSKARDAKRIADISQIQKALEFYYNERQAYPVTISTICASALVATQPTWSSCWASLLSPYLATMPVDPINQAWNGGTGSGYEYTYIEGWKPNGCNQPTPTAIVGKNYILTARLENPKSFPNGCPNFFSNQSDNMNVNYIVSQ